MNQVIYNKILTAIAKAKIGFYYDFVSNKSALVFNSNSDQEIYIFKPYNNIVINPVTFESEYLCYHYTTDNNDNLIINGTFDHNDFNMIITEIENRLGKSITEITSGYIDYQERPGHL